MGQRILLKIGSSVVTTPQGNPDHESLALIARAIAERKVAGDQFLIVGSGAEEWGRRVAQLDEDFDVDESRIEQRGVLRATLRQQIRTIAGQPLIVRHYADAFARQDLCLIHLLVARQDLAEQSRFDRLRSVVMNLLRLGLVPFFAHNALAIHSEPAFGGEDELACLLATSLQVDRLILMTDVDGIFDGPPSDSNSTPIREILDLEATAIRGLEEFGDGVRAKLEAARLLRGFGIEMQIINGRSLGSLRDALSGSTAVGTRFPARGRKLKLRKSWVALAADSRGSVCVSSFLADSLAAGKPASILLIGVEKADGEFRNRDVVTVVDISDRKLGRGQVRMSIGDLKQYLEHRRVGMDSRPSSTILIHCDEFVPAPTTEIESSRSDG